MLMGAAVVSPASAVELEPKARLHLDYANHEADVEPLDDDWIVRRAVIGLEGKFHDDWSFEIGYDLDQDGEFKPSEGEFRDVVLEYDGWGVGDIAVGQFKLPFGFAESTSSNDISFMERALPVDAFPLSRRMGVGFSHERDAYTFSSMLFGSSIDGGDRGRGAAARFTLAPVHSTETVVHLGVAVVTEDPSGKVDFDTTPESDVADVDLVNTGRIDDVNRINRFGLESAWRSGPLSVQAEWMQASVRRSTGPNVELNGWYVAAGWVLTGESRPYKDGRFKGVEPSRAAGAWEFVARYSRIDLDDGDVRGGKERNVTLGLNYYLNQHVRIMLNYVQVQSQRRGQADDPNIVALRVQFAL